MLSEHEACARVLRWLWEKHAATGKLLGLPLPEVMPEHVHSFLGVCSHCEMQQPCAFYQGLVKQGGEESESDPDDSAYDTSGLGSDDSGLSEVASGKTKADKKKQAKKSKGQEKKAKGENRRRSPWARTKTRRAPCRRRRIWGNPRARRSRRQAARPAQ